MIRKQSKEDEIPLTTSKSTILQETKARFESLLRAAHTHSQENGLKKSDQSKGKSSRRLRDIKSAKKSGKWKLSGSSQKLVSEDDHSSSNEPDQFQEDVTETTLEKVRNSNAATSSDESLHSSSGDNSEPSNEVITDVLVQSGNSVRGTPVSGGSPGRAIPLLQRVVQSQTSSRDESRETTSSRVSSSDSVMTAIEATSVIGSPDASPSKKVLQRKPDAHNETLNNEIEEYELKPLKGFSPSYEEIDETNLDSNKNTHKHLSTAQHQPTGGVHQVVSYEEIPENDDERSDVPHGCRNESESTQGSPNEYLYHGKKKRYNKRMKIQMSSKKSKVKGNGIDIDSNTKKSMQGEQEVLTAKSNQRHTSSDDHESKFDINTHYTYDKIISITLHLCDTLKIDSLIRHPMVRVHILDSASGEYLKKSQQHRSVSYFQEGSNIDYIQPLTTRPCSFKDPRSLTPIWEETLIFNEDIAHLLNLTVIILFEVLDCVSFDTAVMQYRKSGSGSGWHRIAWAFLKPRGSNNVVNIDKRLRLQLFRPHSEKTLRSQTVCDKCDVYQWWSKGGWIQYPSTLHVTVNSLPIPSKVYPSLRSYFSLQPEECSFDINHLDGDGNEKDLLENNTSKLSSDSNASKDIVWSRLLMQSCKVPNVHEVNLFAGRNGSLSIKFSHQGFYLAVTAAAENMHNLHVYKVPSGGEIVCFHGHTGLVYSLDWSPNDELLLSASADCTACIWSIKSQKRLQMLPHPSFVYSALFVPGNSLSLATGCCDHVIRIWRQNKQISDFELNQELTGHEGYISTLCVNTSGILFSGDSIGQIRMWQNGKEHFWKPLRSVVNVRELQGMVLNHLLPHPGGKRLLVLARDSLLRMIDISTGVAIQWFKGALNHRTRSNASISPCGGLVFSPSEDGTFFVWNADTGQLIASYTSLFHSRHFTKSYESRSRKAQKTALILGGAVEYHPFEHMAAFSVYGVHAPVIICKFIRGASGKKVGLQLFSGNQNEDSENPMQPLGMDSVVQTAVTVSNVKTHFKENLTKSLTDPASVLEMTQKGIKTDRGMEGKHHLSYIIKQLDYVLQLSRLSTPHQNEELLASHVSTTVSPSSNFQAATHSPVEFCGRDESVDPKNIPEDEKNPVKSSLSKYEEEDDLIQPGQDHLPPTIN